jgi:hypothetical protein
MHLLNLQIKIVSFRLKPFSNFIRQIKFKSSTEDYVNKLFDNPGSLSEYWSVNYKSFDILEYECILLSYF